MKSVMTVMWLFAFGIINALSLPNFYDELAIIGQPLLLEWINYVGNSGDGRVMIGAKLKFAGEHAIYRRTASEWYERIAYVQISTTEFAQLLSESFHPGFVRFDVPFSNEPGQGDMVYVAQTVYGTLCRTSFLEIDAFVASNTLLLQYQETEIQHLFQEQEAWSLSIEEEENQRTLASAVVTQPGQYSICHRFESAEPIISSAVSLSKYGRCRTVSISADL